MYDFKIAAEASDYLKISKAFAIHSNHVSPQIYIIKLLHDDFLLFRINFTNIKLQLKILRNS